jgi:restriction system protein
MSRRGKSSPIEDLIELLARLPWWVCVLLAVLSYAVLSYLAKPAPLIAVQPGQIGQAMTYSIFKALAMAGQYLVPMACLFAAIGSAVGRRHRSQLVTRVAGTTDTDVLHGMSWRDFEILIGEAFRLQGYQVTELGGNGPDGGVDLVLRKDGEKFLVQCKQWKALKVGVQTVRELYGVMAANDATGGFVVTSGRFTEEATEFARGRNVRLLDRSQVIGLIKSAKTARSAPQSFPPIRPPARTESTTELRSESPPPCPSCARTMVPRVAKRGQQAGNSFWGCPSYPVCKGTRPMPFQP